MDAADIGMSGMDIEIVGTASGYIHDHRLEQPRSKWLFRRLCGIRRAARFH